MFKRAKEEIGARAGGEMRAGAADAAAKGLAAQGRPQALMSHKKQLLKWVETDANRPPKTYNIVSSVAYEGLRGDYLTMCTGQSGGLLIVYDEEGAGKSYALQAVARANSEDVEPPRFLTINMEGTHPCQVLYEDIKERVLGEVEHFVFTPKEVAEVVRYGLCGPTGGSSEKKMLPRTKRRCRLDIDSVVAPIPKRRDFPIVVIDEFNPSDFSWEKEYSIRELEKEMADAFTFFNALANLAYQEDGFVAFVGTKSVAVARALHKINGGSKAALAMSTTIHPTSAGYPFSDWQGFRWSPGDKKRVVDKLYAEKLKQALRQQGQPEDQVQILAMNLMESICSHDDRNIRLCCEDMREALKLEWEKAAVKVQARGKNSPLGEGCCTNFDFDGDISCDIL